MTGSTGIVEQHSEWEVRRPAPALSPFVERYIGYRMLGYAGGVHRGLPSRNMTFIVAINDPIDVAVQTDARQSPDRYHAVVGGLQASPALIAHDGNQEGVAIDLTPLGSRAVLGMPAGELWNTSIELDELVGTMGRELWERLQLADDWASRFAACDDVLVRIVRDDDVSPELRRSWECMVTAGGTLPIAKLASEIGWSRQHLARRFGAEFGLSPKLAGRVVRFERARRMLQGTPSFVSIAQVAATCGYFDQAHLTNDFVELAGCTPSQLLAGEDLPVFQDDEVSGSSESSA